MTEGALSAACEETRANLNRTGVAFRAVEPGRVPVSMAVGEKGEKRGCRPRRENEINCSARRRREGGSDEEKDCGSERARARVGMRERRRKGFGRRAKARAACGYPGRQPYTPRCFRHRVRQLTGAAVPWPAHYRTCAGVVQGVVIHMRPSGSQNAEYHFLVQLLGCQLSVVCFAMCMILSTGVSLKFVF